MTTAAANTWATPANNHHLPANNQPPTPALPRRGVHIADQHKRATRRGRQAFFCTKLLVGGLFRTRAMPTQQTSAIFAGSGAILGVVRLLLQLIRPLRRQTLQVSQQISALRQQTLAVCGG